MVERYSISKPLSSLVERFNVEESKKYKPRYNAAPTQILPVITVSGRGGLSFFYWGQTPAMANKKAVGAKWILVDAGPLLEKANLKRKLKTHRCIIPADGFFAWKKVGKKEFVPYRIIPLNHSLFSMAGLWEEYENESGDSIHTFCIIETQSPKIVASITTSLPTLLDEEDEKIWLNPESSPEDLVSVLRPYPNDGLSFHTVSPKINSPDADTPDLIKPAPAADQHGNYSLFD